MGSCVNTLSCGSFCVLCITTQHAHHKSLKQDPDSDLLTQSPATSSTVSPSGSCPPLSYHSGHHRETPGSRNGIPGVLDLSLGLLLPCPQGPGGVGRGEGTRVPVQQVQLPQAWKPLRFLVPSGARVPPDPGDCEMTGGGSSRPGCLLSPLPELAQPRPHPASSSVATPQTAARQASLSITNSRSSLKLMSIESVMPSNHLILCCSLLLPPSIFSSIRVFSNEPVFHIRWPKYWSPASKHTLTLPIQRHLSPAP